MGTFKLQGHVKSMLINPPKLVLATILALAVANPAPAPKPQVILTSAGVPLVSTADIVVPAAASWAGGVVSPVVAPGVVII
ncbi:hypothetical protein ILUMI_22953 [Ignelater luminosus]|uniref:Uncharacterized protein n=1 Tax=Ignelater luminosus TaxID=2038154 RepID=A0A8K0CDG1_IGNLU|nr:hypothetical protein ILUMI_22953 [Ignelater luminosus]